LLADIDHKIGVVDLSWEKIVPTDWFQAEIHRVRLGFQNTDLSFPSMDLELGIDPLLKAHLHSDSNVGIGLMYNKQIEIQGRIHLASLLPNQNLSGYLFTKSRFDFKHWNQPPMQANIRLRSESAVHLGNKLTVKGLELDATLEQKRLQIHTLTITEPVPCTCTGNIFLQWHELANSIYNIQGTYEFQNRMTPFERKGRIAELWP
jgi:hypothetical protein